MPKKKVYFVRHAESQFNSAMRRLSTWLRPSFYFAGCDPGIRDPDVTSVGRKQALEIQPTLVEIVRLENPLILCSPFTRTIRTVQFTVNKPVVAWHDLREVLSTVSDEPPHRKDLLKKFPGLLKAVNTLDYPAQAPLHYEVSHPFLAKEDAAVLRDRVHRVIYHLEEHPASTILIYAHANIIKSLTGTSRSLKNCEIMPTILENGSFKVLSSLELPAGQTTF